MKLFYSYCHHDESFRDAIATSLAPLRDSARIDEWHDRRIKAGTAIHGAIHKNIEDSDIILLLLSKEYLNSSECKAEMRTAMELRSRNGTVVVPVILRRCGWKDYDVRDLLAVPTDAQPVVEWTIPDSAYMDIYENIKTLVHTMPFRPTTEYLSSLTEVEFISQNKDEVRLDDIFVFPEIESSHDQRSVSSFEDLWRRKKQVILHGDDKVGKTAFCRRLVLEESRRDRPVMLLNSEELTSTLNHEAIIRRKFRENYRGSYEYWRALPDRLLIIDDFRKDSNVRFLAYAKDSFERIIITIPTDEYLAYFKSEKGLAEFDLLALCPLGQRRQEELIGKWLSLSSNHGRPATIADGRVDQVEDMVNTIIIHNSVVPRYPFYVLSILQTLEAFMPQGLQITAYGHCYQALITAQILRMGIGPDDIDGALNFLRHLSFRLFSDSGFLAHGEFADFLEEYENDYEINESTWHRLCSDGSLILKRSPRGYEFKYPFVYYFFVGHHLARHYDKHKLTIERMAEKSYLRENAYVLTFVIHHAQDTDLIDSILLHTAFSLDTVAPATLQDTEVRYVAQALDSIPKSIISRRYVSEERRLQRDRRDKSDVSSPDSWDDGTSASDERNEFYKLLKNMEILGQVLRNRHGSMRREKLAEIISFVSDAGLRAVSMFRRDIIHLAKLCSEVIVDESVSDDVRDDVDSLREHLPKLAFVVVLLLLRKIVISIQKPEISRIVSSVFQSESTPAYEVLQALFELATTEDVDGRLVNLLERSYAKLDRANNAVAVRILSLEMQGYLNTHHVHQRQRQRMFSILGLKYRPNRV